MTVNRFMPTMIVETELLDKLNKITYLLRVPDGLQHRQEAFLLGTGREEHHQIVRVFANLLAFEFLQQSSKI